MAFNARRFAAIAFTASALICVAQAHEDDGKVRDKLPAYQGRGVRTGAPSVLRPGSTNQPLPFTSNGVQLMSWLTLHELGGADNANSLWGYTSPAGREYAMLGLSNGTAFVEITNPGAPVIVSFQAGPNSLWRDVRKYQQYAYAVSEGGGGIQVFDLTQIDAGVVTLVGNVTTGGELATHTVCVDEDSGFLYRAGGGSNGLRIYSLANPANPTYVASWGTRYVHEVSVFKYTSGPYANRQIAIACSGYNGGNTATGIDFIDVTNKSNLVVLDNLQYSNARYSHQAWPSADMRYLYLNDEKDEVNGQPTLTKVFDIQNLSNPIERPGFTNGNPAIGHNLYVKGDRMYQANYRSGLRVIDISTPLAPSEVAWFDTFPEDDLPAFNGLWNVYPYFPSGLIIGSDIERGLFVWWEGAALVDADLPNGAPNALSPVGDTVAVSLTEATPGQYAPGSAKLHYNAGAGWVSAPLANIGGLAFEAQFPTLPCGAAVQWYVSADSTNGFTWTEPVGAPTNVYTAIAAANVSVMLQDDFEANTTNWLGFATGDNANSGGWVRNNPIGTPSQPEDDHTDGGLKCWVTGNALAILAPDAGDVDGGRTSLVSPKLTLGASVDPHVQFWLWYSNGDGANPHDDVFDVTLSVDNGGSYQHLYSIGPAGPDTEGGWRLHQFRIRDWATPTNGVRVRFVASDLNGASRVEAAIDDVTVFDVLQCSTAPTAYCTAKPNSQACTPAIASSGAASASSAASFDVSCSNVINQKGGTLFYGATPTSTPFQGGTKCVASPVRRTGVQNSGGNTGPDDCSGVLSIDFNARIQSGIDAALVPGATVFAQFWYRDGADPTGFGTGLSDALQFTIGL
jgi:choice-of-anchor B domain-containing protein